MLCNAPSLVHTLRLSQGRGLTVHLPRDTGPVQAFARGLSAAARCVDALQELSPDYTRTRHTSRTSQQDSFDRRRRRRRQTPHDRRSALRDWVRWREWRVCAVRERCLAGPGDGTHRSGAPCGAIALVGEVLLSNEAVKAWFDLANAHEEARSARIRKDIICSSTLPISAWITLLDRSRPEAYSSSPETGNIRGELR
jgi:hypothetical protein